MTNKLLIAAICLLCACSPLRHYKKVALDDYRNTAEKTLLAKACNEEFPLKLSDTVYYESLDSAERSSFDSAYNALIDAYIKEAELNDTVLIMKDGTKVILRCSGADSARVIKKFLATYNPPPTIRYITKEIQIEDTRKLFAAEQKIKACSDESDAFEKSNAKLTGSRNGWRKAGLIMGGSLLLFIIFLILYLMGKIKLPVRT